MPKLRTFAAALALLLLSASPALCQEEKKPDSPPLLTLTAVEVEPQKPTAETLCRLKVRVENRGEQAASALRFEVFVGGVSLPVYGNQLFVENIAPGATTEVRLYNFWASETGRPAPKDGKLPVRVALAEARWLAISTDAEGVETWELLAPVPGLPSVAEVVLPLAASPKTPAAEPGG